MAGGFEPFQAIPMTLLRPPNSSPNFHSKRTTSKTVNAAVRAGLNVLLIVGFLLGIGVPFFGVLQRDVGKTIEQAEGRKAAAFPEIELKGQGFIRRPETRSIKEFPRQFEKWFNDRIGFRKQLIQVFQVARYYGWTPGLLSQSARPSNLASTGVMRHLSQGPTMTAGQPQVLIGRDGWLFYQTDSVINDYRGTDLFTESELARWKQVLCDRRDWLARRGIRYVFVIAPNKHSVYSENMPRSITRVSEQSRLEQLADVLERETDLTFINLLDPLLAEKSRQRVFHKTDTHWNACGAFLGAQEILTPVKSWFPSVHVPSADDYEMVVKDCNIEEAKKFSPWVKMDLAVMLSSPIPYREQVIDLIPRRADLKVPVQLYGPPESRAERVQHRRFDQGRLSKAFVLHDSCMMALAPFLAPNFQEVTYHWTDDFPAEEIDKARPVLVIQEMVQRRLMTHEPENPRIVTEELRSSIPGIE